MILDVRERLMQISVSLGHWSNEEPVLQYIFQPVRMWLDAQDLSFPPPTVPKSTLLSTARADLIIDTLLVNIQRMLSRCPIYDDETSPADNDNYIKDGSRFIIGLASALDIDGVHDQLHRHLAAIPYGELQRNLQRMLPFVVRYSALAEEQLAALTQWTQTLFKLLFVLCSIIHKIAKDGFCQPPETDQSNPSSDTTEAGDGVGLGEGAGTKDVSKEIEDESQVEGIQNNENDTSDARDNLENEDDNIIEMGEDFGGALEDVPENDAQDDDESDGESQGEPDEQLGDLDTSDPSAVDEKLWADEQGPEDDEEAEKTTEDRSGKGADSEVVSKDDKHTGAEEPKDNQDDEGADPEQAEDIDNDDTTLETLEDEDGGENPEANGAPMDDYVPDANTLDLPDDMDLGFGDDTQDLDDADKDDGSDITNLDDLPDASGDTIDEVPPASPEPIEDESCQGPQEIGGDAPSEDCTGENDIEESAIAQPDISTGDGSQAPEESGRPDDKEGASIGQMDNGSGGTEGHSTIESSLTQEQAE